MKADSSTLAAVIQSLEMQLSKLPPARPPRPTHDLAQIVRHIAVEEDKHMKNLCKHDSSIRDAQEELQRANARLASAREARETAVQEHQRIFEKLMATTEAILKLAGPQLKHNLSVASETQDVPPLSAQGIAEANAMWLTFVATNP